VSFKDFFPSRALNRFLKFCPSGIFVFSRPSPCLVSLNFFSVKGRESPWRMSLFPAHGLFFKCPSVLRTEARPTFQFFLVCRLRRRYCFFFTSAVFFLGGCSVSSQIFSVKSVFSLSLFSRTFLENVSKTAILLRGFLLFPFGFFGNPDLLYFFFPQFP